MINSLFIINRSGDVVLEKHWKSVIHRSLCDYFFDAQKRVSNPEDVPPIISTPHHYLINIYHNNLYFVAVTVAEVPPLMVIEFLHRVVETLQAYFDDCSDNIIKDNYVIVFELLDEMLDNGFPLATELNILQELIKPPKWYRSIANTMTGKTNVSEQLPTGQLSNIPWRRAGVKYTNNEAYFDVTEEIDVIIDKSGQALCAEIQGYIDCCVKLSGMPDLTLTFMNPRLLDDVSFHPCVRHKRWENERVLSFVPPDGNFRLLSYHIGSNNTVTVPVYVRHSIVFSETGGKLDITLGPKQNMGKMLEDVAMTIVLPRHVTNCALTPSQGRYTFDIATKTLSWEIGKIDTSRLPNIRGSIVSGVSAVSAASALPPALDTSSPTINVSFKINQLAVSGLKVNRLDMFGEQYKPFKGVKYISKAGRFQVRT